MPEQREPISSLLRQLWHCTYPNALYQLVQFSIGFSSMLYVGRLAEPQYLASASLGNMICNISGMSVGYGMASALDTLCSQSYGAKQYQLVGLHVQRGLCILTLAAIPTSVIWSYTCDILLYAGVDHDIAVLSHRWVQVLQFSLWANYMSSCLTKYLISMNVLWPIIVASLAAALTNMSINILNYKLLHSGFQGAAVSIVLANWVLFLTLSGLIYARNRYHQSHSQAVYHTAAAEVVNDPTDTWPTPSIQMLQNWSQFLQLGAPAALSLLIEWGSFEAVAFLASNFGVVSLAVHSILQQSCALFYMCPLALATATTTLVGNRLGSGQVRSVISLVKCSFVIAFVYGLINGFVFAVMLRRQWADVFTDETDVLDALYPTLPVLLLYGTFDATKSIAMSVLRGSGRPEITVYGNVLSCLLLMFPASYLLAFKLNMQLVGLWVAMSLAWLSCTLLYGYVIYTTDWQVEASNAVKRNMQAVSFADSDEMELEKLIDRQLPLTLTDVTFGKPVTMFEPAKQVSPMGTPRRRSPHVRRVSAHTVSIDEINLSAGA